MTRLLVAGAFAASLVTAGIAAQSSAAKAPSTTRVAGRVLETGRPVRGALVMIAGTDAGATRVTVTDDSGRFAFTDLPAGHFLVVAGKPAYLQTIYGATRVGRAGTPIVVGSGARNDDLVIALSRGAAISGRVLDANGQPVVGARVRVNPRRAVGTEVLLAGDAGEPANATTDETGAYRVFGLAPGDYLVAVAPRGLSQTETNGASIGNAPAYFPAAQKAEDASVVTLAAGADRTGIDIRVAVARFGRIDGIVSGAETTPANQIQLRPRGTTTAGAVLFSPTTRAGTDGKFSFTNVPPGEYTVSARSLPPPGPDPATGQPRRVPIIWAMGDVTMHGTDEQMILRWRGALTVSGRVTIGGDTQALKDIVVHVGIRPTLASGGPPVPQPATVEADGRFTIANVLPGAYRLYVELPTLPNNQRAAVVPATAMIDGHDAFDEPFTVGPSLGSPDIPVVLSLETQQVDGTLRDAAGHPIADCPVIVFSTDRRFWFPQSRHIATYRTNSSGAFLFNLLAGLPPGEYFVGAVPDLQPGEEYDPAELADVATSARKVTLAADGSQTVQLRLRDIRRPGLWTRRSTGVFRPGEPPRV